MTKAFNTCTIIYINGGINMNFKIHTELIANYMVENHLTKTEFCKQCGISTNSLNKILKQENCNLSSLFKVAKTLGIPIYRLF